MSGRHASADRERTCFRCDRVFRTASADRRVYCPTCRTAYGFPTPTLPSAAVAASKTPRTSPAADPVTVPVAARPRCPVCNRRVRSGQPTCDAESCGEQAALFSAAPDRRQKEWRRDA